MGSQRRLPAGVVTTWVCWPIPTFGSDVIPSRSGSGSETLVRCPDAASSASVVQRWPVAGTHCRSSAQIAQTPVASACSTPHVAQIHTVAGQP